jgi:hypothetical protein
VEERVEKRPVLATLPGSTITEEQIWRFSEILTDTHQPKYSEERHFPGLNIATEMMPTELKKIGNVSPC